MLTVLLEYIENVIVLLEYIDLFLCMTSSLTGKDFQYTYTYYASIMLDAFR